MSKCTDEAFHLARLHGQMELYAESLGHEANPEEYESVALYFEGENNHYLAGKYYMLASSYPEALRHLIKKHPNSDIEAKAIDLAVDCIGKANNETLTTILIEYLMGDHDEMPKVKK
jgi:WD repeat-containing protein 19